MRHRASEGSEVGWRPRHVEGEQQVDSGFEIQSPERVWLFAFPYLAACTVDPRLDHGRNVLCYPVKARLGWPKVRQLMIDLDAVDQALRIFKSGIELDDIKPKPLPPRHAAHKGEVSRIMLAMLNNAKRACTTQELAMRVMAERGMTTADKRLVKTVGRRVGACAIIDQGGSSHLLRRYDHLADCEVVNTAMLLP